MRNNEDRLGPPVEEDSGISGAVQGSDLNFVSPTEFVDLPSRGQYYPANHPLKGKDTIEIKFMTAKEEDILTSKALLKKGIAIDRMLQNLILDKSIRLDDMLTGDKNAIMITSRISAYGSDYEVSVVCPACETKQRFSFDLSSLSHKECKHPSDLGVKVTDRGTFVTVLPKSKVELEFRLLTCADEAKITQELIKKKEGDDSSTSQLKMLVVSVNKQLDPMVKRQFIDTMPAYDARHLRLLIRQITPDIDMSQVFVCDSCGHDEEMAVPLTQDFFWPQ